LRRAKKKRKGEEFRGGKGVRKRGRGGEGEEENKKKEPPPPPSGQMKERRIEIREVGGKKEKERLVHISYFLSCGLSPKEGEGGKWDGNRKEEFLTFLWWEKRAGKEKDYGEVKKEVLLPSLFSRESGEKGVQRGREMPFKKRGKKKEKGYEREIEKRKERGKGG